MPRPDALHEPSGATGLLVNEVTQLGDIDAGRSGGRRRERESLAHGAESVATAWKTSWVPERAGVGAS